MKEFSRDDFLHLQAAEGWLGLKCYAEAEQELDQLAPGLRARPEVLQLRWIACSQAQKWEACAEIGQALIELMPEQDSGWINRSYALRRAPGGSVQSAYDALLPAAGQVKDTEIITFNLACYACQLGRLTEARDWLKKSFTVAQSKGTGNARRREALDDPDLKPLWAEISQM